MDLDFNDNSDRSDESTLEGGDLVKLGTKNLTSWSFARQLEFVLVILA